MDPVVNLLHSSMKQPNNLWTTEKFRINLIQIHARDPKEYGSRFKFRIRFLSGGMDPVLSGESDSVPVIFLEGPDDL